MNVYQVLLPKWLEQHVKSRAIRTDMSYSEVIRIQICVAIISFHKVQFPDYQSPMTVDYISSRIKKIDAKDISKEELQEFVSDLYYETRKALEYRYSKMSDPD